LALTPAALGQDSVSLPTLTRDAIAEEGALEGLLGQRFFRDPDGGLVVVEGQLDDPEAPTELRCTVSFLSLGAMREEWTRLECALVLASGRVARVGSTVVRGRRRVVASGVVAAGTLTIDLTVSEGDEPKSHQTTAAWEDDRLPWAWAVFFLPALRDRLPERFDLRVFHEAVQRLDGEVAGWRRSEQGVELSGVFPGQPPVRVAAESAGWQVDLGGAGLLRPVPDEEGLRLWRAARATQGD
jgi:hypothetical protein